MQITDGERKLERIDETLRMKEYNEGGTNEVLNDG